MTAQTPQVVILGGGYAGLAAATKLRQLEPNLAITVLDARECFIERIRLHEVAAGTEPREWLYAEILQRQRVRFVRAHASRLDLSRRRVVYEGGELSYSHLIYALGSQVPRVPGAQTLESTTAARSIADRLRQRPGHFVVVGAGLTGIELASEVAERFGSWKVTLVAGDALHPSHLPGGYSPGAISALRASFVRRNINLVEGRRAVEMSGAGVACDGGADLESDLAVWTTGFVVPALAAEAGLTVNENGQIITDAHLRSTSHPEVIAIGDAAQVTLRRGQTCRMGSATALAMAMSGARTLAAELQGRASKPFEFSYLFRNISLGRNEAVVQFVDACDRPRDVVWVGSRAVKWKEYICRSTLTVCGLLERDWPPAVPPFVMVPQLARSMSQYA